MRLRKIIQPHWVSNLTHTSQFSMPIRSAHHNNIIESQLTQTATHGNHTNTLTGIEPGPGPRVKAGIWISIPKSVAGSDQHELLNPACL